MGAAKSVGPGIQKEKEKEKDCTVYGWLGYMMFDSSATLASKHREAAINKQVHLQKAYKHAFKYPHSFLISTSGQGEKGLSPDQTCHTGLQMFVTTD